MIFFKLIAFFLSLFLGLVAKDNFHKVEVREGTLFFENGDEVALWGVNFQPPMSSEYYEMKSRALFSPFNMEAYKKMIDESFDQLEFIGVDVIRIHLTPADFSDENGRLVENEWLETLDYTLAEATRRGIYIYLALMNDFGWAVEHSFGRKYPKKEWMFVPEAIIAGERYMKALLNRKNPYDQDRLYKDNPAWVIVEPINEPMFYSREEVSENSPNIEKVYQQWLGIRGSEDSLVEYDHFRYEFTRAYINRILEVFENEKINPIVSWSLNWPRDREWTGDFPFQAAAESESRVFSFSLYPGQSETPKWPENSIDHSHTNFFSYFKRVIQDPLYHGWMLEDRFKNKQARIVYEFEPWSNQNPYIYPLMAKVFRCLGAQVATMWTYRLSGYAEYFSGTHNLNLKTTPQKMASFILAGEIFKKMPRFEKFKTTTDDEDNLDYAYLSYSKRLAWYWDDKTLIHSGDFSMNSSNLEELPDQIVGYGDSPWIQYQGKGLYRLQKLTNQKTPTWELTILPHAKPLSNHWDRIEFAAGGKTVDLDYKTKASFRIRTAKSGKNYFISSLLEKNSEAEKIGNFSEFIVQPGNYRIYEN